MVPLKATAQPAKKTSSIDKKNKLVSEKGNAKQTLS